MVNLTSSLHFCLHLFSASIGIKMESAYNYSDTNLVSHCLWTYVLTIDFFISYELFCKKNEKKNAVDWLVFYSSITNIIINIYFYFGYLVAIYNPPDFINVASKINNCKCFMKEYNWMRSLATSDCLMFCWHHLRHPLSRFKCI